MVYAALLIRMNNLPLGGYNLKRRQNPWESWTETRLTNGREIFAELIFFIGILLLACHFDKKRCREKHTYKIKQTNKQPIFPRGFNFEKNNFWEPIGWSFAKIMAKELTWKAPQWWRLIPCLGRFLKNFSVFFFSRIFQGLLKPIFFGGVNMTTQIYGNFEGFPL